MWRARVLILAPPDQLVAFAGPAGAVGAASASPPVGPAVVTTDNETPVLYDDDEGGNASGDDPAIWVHPRDSRARS